MYTLDKKQIRSIIELVQKFPTEDECYELLEKIRWNGKVVSPYDKNSKVYKSKIINIVVKRHESILM